jgi:hypothetical protein
MQSDYLILDAGPGRINEVLHELQEITNSHLQNGYKLLGGVIIVDINIVYNESRRRYRVYQTVYKEHK